MKSVASRALIVLGALFVLGAMNVAIGGKESIRRDGEVVYLPGIAQVRQLPAHTMEVTLMAVDAGGARELGRYTFRHQPWPGP